MVEALINPELIRWARQRRGLAPEEAARKVGVVEDTFTAWENNRSRPTFAQAVNIARRFNVPLGYLYLQEPPDERLPLPDLRTVRGVSQSKPSPEFLDVLYDALRKQDWYKEHLQEEGAESLPFIGRFNGDASPEQVAADIRDTLGIDQRFRQAVNTWEEFLTQLISRAEGARILVLRSSYAGTSTRRTLDVQEFRGFAISDPVAPLIFINSADWKAAQIFTLVHELAHLWIGATGISNPDYLMRPKEQEHDVDRRCDEIAAEMLVPQDDFLLAWSRFKPLDQNIDDLARRYRVSSFVILRRAFDLEQIDRDKYRKQYDALLTKVVEKKKKGGGKETFYNTVIARNSPVFTITVVLAAAEGRVTSTEAASLLGVHLGTMSKVEQHVLVRLQNA